MLSGAVNLTRCPACGFTGSLNVPFLYHDPEKEVALLYLPVDAGETEVQRQKLAGELTRQVMNALPPEERKGYLLQPETFISMDTMVKRVLELEGVSEEDLERSRDQQLLFQSLLEADREEWEGIIAENEEHINPSFFTILEYTMRTVAMSHPESEELEKLRELEEYLVENHPVGQMLNKRAEVISAFLDEPNRETLVEALVNAPDDGTVRMLVEAGVPLLDYGFFQRLVKRIEAADEEEAERLRKLRRKILDLRQELAEASRDVVNERLDLVQKLLSTEEPLKMARAHLSELDDVFSYVLQGQLQQAAEEGDDEYLGALQGLVEVLNRVVEESMPPEVALARRLMMTTSDEEVTELLEESRDLVTPAFVEFLESLEEQSRQAEEAESAERLAELRAKAQQYVTPSAPPQAPRPQEPSAPESDLGPGEERTDSGLIISKR
jgi:hypothetical protein